MSSISKIKNQLESLASSLQNLPPPEKEVALKLVESTLLAQRQKESIGVTCQKLNLGHSNIPTNSECNSELACSHDFLNRVPKHQRPCPILLPQQEEVISRSPESTSLSQSRFPFEKGQAQSKKKGALLQKRRRFTSLLGSNSGYDEWCGQETKLSQFKIKENCGTYHQNASKRKSSRKSLQIPLQKKRKFSQSFQKASNYCSTPARKSIETKKEVDDTEFSCKQPSLSGTVREEAEETLKVLRSSPSSPCQVSEIREQVSQTHDETEKISREETKGLSFVREIHQQTKVSLRGSESIQRIPQKFPRPIDKSGVTKDRDQHENTVLHFKDEGTQKSLQLPQAKKSIPPKQTGIPQISNASVIVTNDSISVEKQRESGNKCEPKEIFATERCSDENSVRNYDSVEMFPSYVWSEEDKSKMPEDLREATLNLEKSLSRLKEQQQLHLMQHRSILESDVVDVLSVDTIDERHHLTDSGDILNSHYSKLYSDQDKTMTTNLLDRSLHLLGLSQPDCIPSKNVDTQNLEFSSQTRDASFDENEASINYNIDEPTDLTISSEMKEKNLANQMGNQLKMDHFDQFNIDCKSTYPQNNSSYPLCEYGTDMCHTEFSKKIDYYSQQHLILNETNVVYDLSISASRGNNIESSYVDEVTRQESSHLGENVYCNGVELDQTNHCLNLDNPLTKEKLPFSVTVDENEINLQSEQMKLSDDSAAHVSLHSKANSVSCQFVSSFSNEVNDKGEKSNEIIRKDGVAKTDPNPEVSSGYQCKFCSKRFRLKSNHDSHVNGHSRHKCCECGGSFSSFKALYIHCKKKHNITIEGKTYNCSSCNKKFTKKIHLNAHIVRFHGRDNQCTKCSAVFDCKEMLQEHVKTHTSFSCSLCQRSFEKRRNLLRHIDSHRRNECNTCKESFSTKNLLLAHQKEMHLNIDKEREMIVSSATQTACTEIISSNDKERKSSEIVKSVSNEVVCSNAVTSSTISSHQLALHPAHVCSLCQRSFCRPSLLKEHQDIVHTKSRVLGCEVCQKIYSSRKSLRKHLESKLHQEKMIGSRLETLNSYQNVTLKQNEVKNVPEGISDSLTTSAVKDVTGEETEPDQNANTLSSNQNEMSVNVDSGKITAAITPCTDTLLYKCQSCDLASAYSTSMQRHTKLHQTVKRYICELCGKMLATHSALKEHHVFIHSKKRNFACSLCSKSFKNKSTLNRHLREHNNSRANVCTKCGASYKRLSHLKRHLNTTHANKREKCDGAKKSDGDQKTDASDGDQKTDASDGDQKSDASDCDQKSDGDLQSAQNNITTVCLSESSGKEVSLRSVLSIPSYVFLNVNSISLETNISSPLLKS